MIEFEFNIKSLTESMINPGIPVKALLLFVFVSVLNGCIYRDLSESYQQAEDIKTIKLPDSLSHVEQEPLFPIPEIKVKEESFYDIKTDGFIVPRPEPMSAEREQAKIKIQKVGSKRWVLVEAPTSQVWPLTQSFLSQSGISVINRVPDTGLVETAWVEFKSATSKPSQFRVLIEKGLRPETTEIHIVQRDRSVEIGKVWPNTSIDPEREAWLLEAMANSLAGNIQNRAASLLGQSVGGEVKAKLFMGENEPLLGLSLEEGRAWATVAHALEKEGFMVWEEDSENRVFYAQFSGFEKKRGWFKRLFMGSPEQVEKVPSAKLSTLVSQLEDSPGVRDAFKGVDNASFVSAAQKFQGYLVVLQRRSSDDLMIVRIRKADGTTLELKNNKHLLAVIRRNLI